MATISIGTEAPDFILDDLNGERMQLSALRGTPVILNFFHTGCTWCRAMMPQIDGVYDKYPEMPVAMIGIVVGEDTPDTARTFVREADINIFTGVDTTRLIREAYGLDRVPTIMLLDRAGRILRIFEGSSEQLPGIIDQAVLSLAEDQEPPELAIVGNGCAP